MLERRTPRCLALSMIRLAMIAVTLQTVAFAQVKRPVTFEDLNKITRLEQLRLSPNGETLAYTVEDQPELMVVATRPGSIPRSIGKGTVPRWSPNGKMVAYYSRQSGTLQLWTFDVPTGSTEQITYVDGGIKPDHHTCCIGLEWHEPESYGWSPDSTRLVFHAKTLIATSRRDRASQTTTPHPANSTRGEPLILTTTTAAEWTLAGIYRIGGFMDPSAVQGNEEQSSPDPAMVTTDQLFIADVFSKAIFQLTKDDLGYFSPEWSPDGKSILCISNEGREIAGWGSGPTNVYRVDVATGKRMALTADNQYKNDASWSPNGQWISYLGAAKADLEGVFLFVFPSSGGTAVNVTRRLDRRPYAPTYWTADSSSIVINYPDGVDWKIARVDVYTGDTEVLSEPTAAARFSLTVANSGTIAWNQKDPACPSCIRVLPKSGSSPYVLLDLNPQIKELQLGQQEIIRWKNGRGEEMEGVLIKPTEFEPGRRYPLIVDAYPKQPNGFKGSPMVPAQAWASRGYAVFFPNGDGPNAWENPWKSMGAMKAAKGAPGLGIAVDDVVSGVDELIGRGIVDPDRMCLYGFSNGGAIVNQVITRTNRFKCAISIAAALSADWTSNFFLHTSAHFVAKIAGATPWEDPRAYFELSAVQHLDKVVTPLLLADGDDDGGSVLDNIEMYNGLRWLGKDVTLLRYPGQEHGFTGAAMKDFWERENDFLDSYLKRASK